jgi:lyso-ornithine lipid O-acyltransferase
MMQVRACLVLAGFLVMTLALMPVQFLLRRVAPQAARRLPYFYHRALARWLGIDVRVSGLVPQGGALLVSNHVSWIDIVALSAVAPVSFIAKREVRSWPLFGLMARLQNCVFIDRNRRLKTGEARNDIAARLKARDTLVLFAEGTSHDGVSVLPFKAALIAAADTPGIPVVPVTLAYARTWNLPMSRRERPFYAWYGDMELAPHLWEAIKSGPIGVDIVFHPPLAGDAHRKILAGQAQDFVKTTLALRLQGYEGDAPSRFTAPGK